MQIFKKSEPVSVSYPLKKLGDPKKILFFDIETTGLTPSNAQVYLIGAFSCTGENSWELVQFFADSLSSEQEILKAFFKYAEDFNVLVHFNGENFDLPFLKKCADEYHLKDPLCEIKSIDLYRAIRPYRKILGTDRMNQKTMEKFLGLNREDRYTGAELISVYQSFLSDRDAENLRLLLLHNEDDVTGLVLLLSLLSYRDFFDGGFKNPFWAEHDDRFILNFESESILPKKISLSLSPVLLNAENNMLELSVKEYRGILRHFFEDYRDYYYLPAEDAAIHKSVGEFVDKNSRIKATRETACVKKDGVFFPVFGPETHPVFYREYKDLIRYVQKDDCDFSDQKNLLKYGYSILKYLGLKY